MAAREQGPGGNSVASGSAKVTARMPRGLAKRTAVPAALRTECSVTLATLPTPTIRRRLAASPAGACSSKVSLAAALNSPEASTAAAAAVTVVSLVSSAGSGLASGPLAVCASAAITINNSVSIPERGAKTSSVFMSLIISLRTGGDMCDRSGQSHLKELTIEFGLRDAEKVEQGTAGGSKCGRG